MKIRSIIDAGTSMKYVVWCAVSLLLVIAQPFSTEAQQVAPDLTVVSVSAPASAGAGDVITVSDTVAASPTGGNAGAFYVSYYLSADSTITTSDTCLGTRYITSLATGASSSGSTTVTLPKNIIGAYYVGAIVDMSGSGGNTSSNRVPESDETNNALAGNQIAVTGADLTVVSVSAPASAGDVITANI